MVYSSSVLILLAVLASTNSLPFGDYAPQLPICEKVDQCSCDFIIQPGDVEPINLHSLVDDISHHLKLKESLRKQD